MKIDLDYDPRYRDKIVEYLINKWGREQVAHIGTYGTFRLQSIAQDETRISEPVEPRKPDFSSDEEYEKAVLKYKKEKKTVWDKFEKLDELIPAPKYGIQPTYEDMISQHPEITTEFKSYNQLAGYADGMRKQIGVHAAGIVLSDFPISDLIPIYKNDTYERITQFDKDEVEELGLIKFDELVIDTLSIISDTIKLIKEELGINIDIVKDIYEKDGDKKAYALLNKGMLAGIFQFETSPKSKELIFAIKPNCIQHLSDISALNRPGPLQSSLDKLYIDNKNTGISNLNTPEAVSEILKDTYGVMIYQEQVMKLCSVLAGFTLKESDNVRKSMGKKDRKKLEKTEDGFIQGCLKLNLITEFYARKLWQEMIGFSEYAFCLAHSISYSFISYASAYLKANYPIQFFTALMTIRSQELSPEKWQEKVKEYTEECKFFGIKIAPPDINSSEVGFRAKNDTIYFGLTGIKTIAKSSAVAIIKARDNKPFTDIMDFLNRVNKSKVNTAKFEALSIAGCFDRMGYLREDLITNKDNLYDYFKNLNDYKERLIEHKEREKEREKILALKALGNKEKLLPVLKLKDEPISPEINRHSKIRVSFKQLREQAELIGCFLGSHPSLLIKGEYTDISSLYIGERSKIRCLIQSVKEITTKKNTKMAFVTLEDSTGKCEGTIFTSIWEKNKNIKPGSLAKLSVKPEKEEPLKVIVERIELVEIEGD